MWQSVDTSAFVVKRPFQTSLGEGLLCAQSQAGDLEAFAQKGGRFVVCGLEESIGVIANHGRGGTDKAWHSFLKFFLNMQLNHFFPAKIVLLGGSLKPKLGTPNADAKGQVEALDELVSTWMAAIFSYGLTPIVIGGGHNNAYPLLKAASTHQKRPVGAINLDAHLDLRPDPERHSGNGFRHAMEEGYLGPYSVLCAQKAYATQNILDFCTKHAVNVQWLEDLLDAKLDLAKLTQTALAAMNDAPWGLEFCLDAVCDMPSSARSPVGLPPLDAITVLRLLSKQRPLYAHLPEGAPDLGHDGERSVGKFLASLVWNFIVCAAAHKF